ncbi:hypothetical protein RJ639_042836, partial [Escallonia herrerae]
MVNYMLMITAEFDNIKSLQPQGGCDDPSFTYYFKLKCGNCGEVTEKEAWLNLDEKIAVPKGSVNLVQKCKCCGREGTITMVPNCGHPLTEDLVEQGEFAPMMLFDCRGYEPFDFAFGSGWRAESLEGTKFNDIDLSEEEFSEYCEKGKCPVMISNLRAIFKVVK